jgi:hypothetical protein
LPEPRKHEQGHAHGHKVVKSGIHGVMLHQELKRRVCQLAASPITFHQSIRNSTADIAFLAALPGAKQNDPGPGEPAQDRGKIDQRTGITS